MFCRTIYQSSSSVDGTTELHYWPAKYLPRVLLPGPPRTGWRLKMIWMIRYTHTLSLPMFTSTPALTEIILQSTSKTTSSISLLQFMSVSNLWQIDSYLQRESIREHFVSCQDIFIEEHCENREKQKVSEKRWERSSAGGLTEKIRSSYHARDLSPSLVSYGSSHHGLFTDNRQIVL